MTEAAKLQSLVTEWNKNNSLAYIFWFDETLRKAEAVFAKETTQPILLLTAREVTASHLSGKTVVFAEHYPLPLKEKEFFLNLHLEEVQVWSALDEPLFIQFGGEKIAQMMKQLGMKEEEAIEHKMISKAIQNAQKKIEKKVMFEQTARSQEDWLEKNLTR